MSEFEYDVAIVGGSIAGCTAATLFGRAGRRVALIESHPDPAAYKKLCTTFIHPSAVPSIQRLGLDERIESEGGVRNGIDVWARWGWIRRPVSASGTTDHGYSIQRQKLDPMLRELAGMTPGVDLLLGSRARSLIRENGRIRGVGTTDTEGRTFEIRAKLVVAADGRNSAVAELADVGARRWKSHKRAVYFALYKNVALSAGTKAQVWFLNPDLAYAFPMDDGLTILAYGFPQTQAKEFKQDIEENFVRRFESLPDGPRFDPQDRVGPVMGVIDYPTIWRRSPPPGLAFIGDAAITADYVWGVGCGWAFQSAEWLADATSGSLDSPERLDAGVKRYRRHLRKLAAHFVLVCDYQTGRRLNPIEKLLFSAGAKDPVTAELIQAFSARSIPVREFLAPSALARAARVNLTHRGPKNATRSAGPKPRRQGRGWEPGSNGALRPPERRHAPAQKATVESSPGSFVVLGSGRQGRPFGP
jgi:2-polyprenyl-6-methoxyphenol hydroxylase-like FAD-dependent oxidoreductase